MRLHNFVAALSLVLLSSAGLGQGLDSRSLLKPLSDAWPTYNGDYSGRRYSALSQINSANINSLAVNWIYHTNVGPQRGVGIPEIKSTPLLVNSVLYFTIPNHVWAVDARTGDELWHYAWQDKGGHLVGNRGVGMYGDWLYFLAPDGWFISLNAKDGKERWRKKIADEKRQYFTTMAPLVVRNHVIVGVGGDAMDVPGFLEARDPETGEIQWRWNTTPRPGEFGADTWPNKNSMEHGGGMTWLTGTYDPDLNLLYWGTGNPNPVYAGQGRKGSNLWTCSIVALNADTGKLVWHFQASPHDTHDWDNVETPVLFDAEFGGQKRKLLAQAARNGYFFVLDRTNGKNLVSKGFVGVNWSKGADAEGRPIPDPAKEPKVDGSLINIPGGGGTNWPPPSFNPETGLFYVNARKGYSVAYLTDTEENPEGYGGIGGGLLSQAVLKAIDYKTGNVVWSHDYPSGSFGNSGPGILTTAGKLLFTGDPSGNLIAYDPATGRILWHFRTGSQVSNGPMTYELNGTQYLVVGAGDTLFAFTILRNDR
ncbi:MAG TPA: acido-empty-quinoprotein group A [Blastocatellia bacterium]|jgi:alcohol dehydrogenase (cytochrome c)|nr:acido-empty-quinoprotein group A [Blastocatellia bacterium]